MTEPFAKLRMALFCYGIAYFIVWNYVFYYVVAQDILRRPLQTRLQLIAYQYNPK